MSASRRWPAALVLGTIALCYLWVFPYHGTVNNPNENVRVYMTKAIVDEGTFAINGVNAQWGYVNDKAIRDGELYSAKAPGASYLGVPVYAVTKALHGLGSDEPMSKTATIYWLRLGTIVIPSLCFVLLFYFFTALWTDDRYLRAMVAAAHGLGTMAFTYGEMFAGHALMAVFSFGSFMALYLMRAGPNAKLTALRWPRGLDWARRALLREPVALAVGGFLVGWAAITEYPAAGMGLILGAYALSITIGRRSELPLFQRLLRGGLAMGWMALGAAIPLGLGAFYHDVCFGSPMSTAYAFLENQGFIEDMSPGFHGISAPNPKYFFGAIFSSNNGLYWFSPFLLFGSIMTVVAVARRKARAEAAVIGAVLVVYTLFISSLSIWHGGWTAGPRYIMHVGPFLCLGALVGLEALRGTRWATPMTVAGVVFTLVSIVVAGVSSITFPHFPNHVLNPVFELAIPMLADGWTVYNAGHLIGVDSWVSMLPVYLTVLAVMAYLLAGPRRLSGDARRLFAAASLALTVAGLAAMTIPETKQARTLSNTQAYMREVWTPLRPGEPDLGDRASLEGARGEAARAAGLRAALLGRSGEALRWYHAELSD